jgi:hypothetical protein
MIKVLGIKIYDRIKEAGLTQGILSKYASVITTRLGFHEVTDDLCSREAYILLHLKDGGTGSDLLRVELEPLGGILIREMIFDPDAPDASGEKSEGSTEVLGLLIQQNPGVINSVQQILTSYGCYIRTRLGVNELFYGEPAGLIILELTGDQKQRDLLETDLKSLPGVQVRKMMF